MCYKHPGPRCSAYAKKFLQEALARAKETGLSADYDLAREAQEAYYLTPAGQTDLTNQIAVEVNAEKKADLQYKLQYAVDARALAIKAAKATDQGDITRSHQRAPRRKALAARTHEIKQSLHRYFSQESVLEELAPFLSTREAGHGMATKIDDMTEDHMRSLGFRIAHETDPATGKKRTRSVGDFWIMEDDGTYNPVNVKTGLLTPGVHGAPNIVSMHRLRALVASGEVSSYYLAIVKFDVQGEKPVPHIHFVDILQHIKYLRYNHGTGQVMLKERDFYGMLNDPKQYKPVVSKRRQMTQLKSLYASALVEAERKLSESKKVLNDFNSAAKTDRSFT